MESSKPIMTIVLNTGTVSHKAEFDGQPETPSEVPSLETGPGVFTYGGVHDDGSMEPLNLGGHYASLAHALVSCKEDVDRILTTAMAEDETKEHSADGNTSPKNETEEGGVKKGLGANRGGKKRRRVQNRATSSHGE